MGFIMVWFEFSPTMTLCCARPSHAFSRCRQAEQVLFAGPVDDSATLV